MNNVNRSQHLDETVEPHASDRFGVVGSSVIHSVENLPLDVTKHAVTVNGSEAVTAGNDSDAVDQQPTLADRKLVDNTNVLTVNNIASVGVSAVRRNTSAVPTMQPTLPAVQPSSAAFRPPSMHKPQLLPPTAFLSRADGTPIIDTEADHGRTSEFEKRGKSWKRDGVSLDTQVSDDSKMKDGAADWAGECSQQLESDCDHMADLLYVQKTLRTFADNKDKLKYEAFFFQLLMS